MSDDERSLWERRPETEQQLAERYWPLVVNMARKRERKMGYRWSADELAGFGAVGLMQAIRRFDLARGMEPKTLLCLRIQGAIIDGIRGDQMCGYCASRRAGQGERIPEFVTNFDRRNSDADPMDVVAVAAPDSDPEGIADYLLSRFHGKDVYCVVRVYLMGERMQDVGREIGCSESMVSLLCTRGKDRLRQHLPEVLRAMGRECVA